MKISYSLFTGHNKSGHTSSPYGCIDEKELMDIADRMSDSSQPELLNLWREVMRNFH